MIRALLLEEIVKAINAHDYGFDAQVDRNGRIHVSYSETVSGSTFSGSRANVSLTLKVED